MRKQGGFIRRAVLLPLCGAVLLLASCATNDGVNKTWLSDKRALADHAALVAAGGQWNALHAAQDWAGLRALYEDDAWLMTDKAPAYRNADAIIEYLKGFAASGAVVTFQFAPEDVAVDRPYGFVTAKYWMSAKMPTGPEVKTAGRSFLVYKWNDDQNRWRLWRDIDNTSPDVFPDPPLP